MTIQSVINWLVSFAYIMPVIVFVPLGLLLDELFLPVPAPVILTVGGAVAKTQGFPFAFLIVLALAGGFGKVLGMWFHYFLGDKAEHFLVPKYGKMFGVTEKEIEKLSNKLQGGWRDTLVIFISRAVPFIPTIPVSFICGILKTNLKSFLIASFVGTTIRSFIFLYAGYIGASTYQLVDTQMLEKISIAVMIAFFVGFSIWYYKAQKRL